MQCAKPKAITKSRETNENWAKEWAWVQSWLANNCNLLSQEPARATDEDGDEGEAKQNALTMFVSDVPSVSALSWSIIKRKFNAPMQRRQGKCSRGKIEIAARDEYVTVRGISVEWKKEIGWELKMQRAVAGNCIE